MIHSPIYTMRSTKKKYQRVTNDTVREGDLIKTEKGYVPADSIGERGTKNHARPRVSAVGHSTSLYEVVLRPVAIQASKE